MAIATEIITIFTPSRADFKGPALGTPSCGAKMGPALGKISSGAEWPVQGAADRKGQSRVRMKQWSMEQRSMKQRWRVGGGGERVEPL